MTTNTKQKRTEPKNEGRDNLLANTVGSVKQDKPVLNKPVQKAVMLAKWVTSTRVGNITYPAFAIIDKDGNENTDRLTLTKGEYLILSVDGINRTGIFIGLAGPTNSYIVLDTRY